MENELVFKAASQDEIHLYCFMGEALCMIQELEEALSHSITLKKYHNLAKSEADAALNKHRKRYTLGKAVQFSEKERLYSLSIQVKLNEFYQKRNWLVHKAMFENREDLDSNLNKEKLFQKIKSIANDAQVLQHEIELDMVNFCTSKGKNMSNILTLIEERYKKT